nr:LamG domain-containing protein [Bacteriovorax sp. HI3]
MKKLILSVFLLSLITSCSNSSGSGSSKSLPGGASATFDAENANGDRSIPSTGCSISTWVNTSNSALNGSLDCSMGGGFAGNGIFTSPYRFEFNGTSTVVTTSINARPSALSSTTWMAWVYPTSTTFQHVLSIDNHSGSYNRALVIQNSNWSAFTGTSTTFESHSIDVNQWQHIAVVYTPSGITVYKNGTASSYGSAPTINNVANTFTIGRSAGGAWDYFQGSIAWVAVYPRELGKSEIQSACRALANRFDAIVCDSN